jgi:hypothetical protein
MPIGRWGVERQALGLPGVNSWNAGGLLEARFSHTGGTVSNY